MCEFRTAPLATWISLHLQFTSHPSSPSPKIMLNQLETLWQSAPCPFSRSLQNVAQHILAPLQRWSPLTGSAAHLLTPSFLSLHKAFRMGTIVLWQELLTLNQRAAAISLDNSVRRGRKKPSWKKEYRQGLIAIIINTTSIPSEMDFDSICSPTNTSKGWQNKQWLYAPYWVLCKVHTMSFPAQSPSSSSLCSYCLLDILSFSQWNIIILL